MRILFFAHYFPPEVNAPATRTFEHCARWVRAGHDVTVVTCQPNCPNGVVFPGYKNTLGRRVDHVDGIRVVRVWTFLAPNAGTVRRIANYVSFMVSAAIASLRIRRPDVIVATSPQFFCGWAGVIASWLKWRPLVLEIRDIWPESIQAVGAVGNRPLLWVLERMERLMYRAATHIVAVGDGYRENILSKVDVHDRISVITNGVDVEQYQPRPSDPEMRKAWKTDGRFVCSYVGTIGMAHGLDVVLKAAQILKNKGRNDVAFVLVGDGARRAELQRRAEQEELSDIVKFMGRCPKQQMPNVLASSDACLVHLKKTELFATVIPSKIFETMAMGRPIIMGVDGEARQIVHEAGAGIDIEPDSAESLVAAVERLADDAQLRQELGRYGREYVARNYNRDVLAGQMLAVLERVAGKDTNRG